MRTKRAQGAPAAQPVATWSFVVGLLVVLAAGAMQSAITQFWGVLACGGDSGQTPVPGSPLERVCEATQEHFWVLELLAVAVMGFLLWRGYASLRQRRARPFVLALVFCGVLFGIELAAAGLPSLD